ncbi:MAG: hypothetical protein ACPGOY_18645 [Rhodospirillaceae bacterium]
MSSFSGYILEHKDLSNFSSDRFEQRVPIVHGGPALSFIDFDYGLKKWSKYKLVCFHPLNEEEKRNQPPPYEYDVYIIVGQRNILILSPRKRISEYTKSNILDKKIYPNIKKVNIRLDDLISHCSTNKSEFLITSLHGRFSGSSKNLRSMSLYGDNVTESSLYSENAKYFNFHSCGLGRRLFDGLPRLSANPEGEIVRIGFDGFLTLNISSRKDALELNRVIKYIVQNEWIEG